MNCTECNKEIPQTVGKRAKIFCNSTCRSNHWQKEKRKQNSAGVKEEKPVPSTDQGIKQKSTEKNILLDTKSIPVIEEKHRLWKEGDPKENSAAFMMKYDCVNYSELEKKQFKK